jgi:small-conductance mechanosensitive channel
MLILSYWHPAPLLMWPASQCFWASQGAWPQLSHLGGSQLVFTQAPGAKSIPSMHSTFDFAAPGPMWRTIWCASENLLRCKMMQWWCMMQVCFKMHDAEWHEQRQQRFLMSTRLLMRVLMPLMHWAIKFQSLDWILEPLLLIFSRPAMFLGSVARCFGYWDARKLWVDSHDFTLCSPFFLSQTPPSKNAIFTLFSIIYKYIFNIIHICFLYIHIWYIRIIVPLCTIDPGEASQHLLPFGPASPDAMGRS